jgi:hypothetical protein
MAVNADHTSKGIVSISSSGREWSTGVALRRLRRILASLPFPTNPADRQFHSRAILNPPRARHAYRSIVAQNSVADCHSHSSHSRAGHRLCGAGSGNASAIIASTVAIALVLPIRRDEWVIALPRLFAQLSPVNYEGLIRLIPTCFNAIMAALERRQHPPAVLTDGYFLQWNRNYYIS